MMATLGVHEAMGAKVDREAVASLVLPQLWAMSMGPLLDADQFGHFMTWVFLSSPGPSSLPWVFLSADEPTA